MKLGVDRRPARVQVVIIDPKVPPIESDIGVQDDFEPMTVHASALVTGRNVRQTMRRFENVTPPDVGLLVAVDIGAFVQGALDTHLFNACNPETISYPAGEVFVGRLLEAVVQ